MDYEITILKQGVPPEELAKIECPNCKNTVKQEKKSLLCNQRHLYCPYCDCEFMIRLKKETENGRDSGQ